MPAFLRFIALKNLGLGNSIGLILTYILNSKPLSLQKDFHFNIDLSQLSGVKSIEIYILLTIF